MLFKKHIRLKRLLLKDGKKDVALKFLSGSLTLYSELSCPLKFPLTELNVSVN